jgi:pimeloyl-ACP methyl ester carboxylesterase
MGLDVEALYRHRKHEDNRLGIEEEFLVPEIGAGRTVAVLTRPLGPSGPVGWVVCHAFGIEQIHLERLDVLAARALAAAGFPTLRFHGQGYGDSDLEMDAISLTSHRNEARDAVDLLRDEAGVEQVGVAGARLGGTVAAMVAEELSLPFLVMWEPVVNGSQYVSELVRSHALFTLMSDGGDVQTVMRGVREDLATQGWADVKGFRLTRAATEDIGAVDLTSAISTFSGASLLMALTRTGKPSRSLSGLAQKLASMGPSTFEVLQDPVAPGFGQFRWHAADGGRSKKDTQLELNERMVAMTAEWAASRYSASNGRKAAP